MSSVYPVHLQESTSLSSTENVESHDLDLSKWRPNEDTRKMVVKDAVERECVIQDHISSELNYVSCTPSGVDLSLSGLKRTQRMVSVEFGEDAK
jgi:hypothetical protein